MLPTRVMLCYAILLLEDLFRLWDKIVHYHINYVDGLNPRLKAIKLCSSCFVTYRYDSYCRECKRVLMGMHRTNSGLYLKTSFSHNPRGGKRKVGKRREERKEIA